MERYDAIIVGAGPAGASLALWLGRAGRSCLLVDGARFPRHKVCGEGIMPAGSEVLEQLGLRTILGEMGQTFQGIRYLLADGSAAQATFPDGAKGLGIQRQLLDTHLVHAAQREQNVDVRLGTWVRELRLPGETGADHVEAVVDGTPVRAPVLIGADGGRSSVRRQAGLEAPPPRRLRFGIGGHFVHAPLPDDPPVVEVFVGPGYEVYTTPVAPDTTAVALLVEQDDLKPYQGRFEEGLREILAAAGPRGELLAASERVGRVTALGPLALQAKAAHAERVLLVGDAAGALDPITGEGISLALVGGRIVGQLLEECYAADDFSARRLSSWTRQRKREVRPLASLTRLLLYLADRPQHAGRVIRSLARSPGTFERLLGVAAGTAPLGSLTIRDGMRVLLGV